MLDDWAVYVRAQIRPRCGAALTAAGAAATRVPVPSGSCRPGCENGPGASAGAALVRRARVVNAAPPGSCPLRRGLLSLQGNVDLDVKTALPLPSGPFSCAPHGFETLHFEVHVPCNAGSCPFRA